MVKNIPLTELPHVLLHNNILGPKLCGGSFSPTCQFRVPNVLATSSRNLKKKTYVEALSKGTMLTRSWLKVSKFVHKLRSEKTETHSVTILQGQLSFLIG